MHYSFIVVSIPLGAINKEYFAEAPADVAFHLKAIASDLRRVINGMICSIVRIHYHSWQVVVFMIIPLVVIGIHY